MTTPPPSSEDLHRQLRDNLFALLLIRHEALRADRMRTEGRTEWLEIRAALARHVVASDAQLDRYATWALAARRGHPLRLLLLGQPGSGKSHIAKQIASAIGSTYRAASLGELSEAGWHGIHLSDLLATYGGDITRGGTIVLDEVDKAAVRPGLQETSAAKYKGQIGILLTLMDRGGEVLLDGGSSVRSDRMHVILAGSFSDAEWASEAREPSREELRRYGIPAEVLDRIDHIEMLTPPPAELIAQIVAADVEDHFGLATLARSLGYEIQIDPAAALYAARLHSSGPTAGTRTARAAIEAAMMRVLTRALQEGEIRSTLTVAPDDVLTPRSPPSAPRRPGPDGPDDGAGSRAVL